MTLEPLDAPPCPLCGERMSLKVAQRGRRVGNSFWGCPRFPACQGLLDLAHGFDEPSAAKVPDAKPKFDGDEFRLRIGGFVWTYDRALLGKLTELAPGRARVRIVSLGGTPGGTRIRPCPTEASAVVASDTRLPARRRAPGLDRR